MEKSITSLILAQCKTKNKSMEYLATKMGVSRAHIYKLIRNPNISAVNLQKLSQIIGYNFFNHLYSDSDHPTPEQWHELHRAKSRLQRENAKLLEQVQILTQTNLLLSAQLGLIHPPNQPPKT